MFTMTIKYIHPIIKFRPPLCCSADTNVFCRNKAVSRSSKYDIRMLRNLVNECTGTAADLGAICTRLPSQGPPPAASRVAV